MVHSTDPIGSFGMMIPATTEASIAAFFAIAVLVGIVYGLARVAVRGRSDGEARAQHDQEHGNGPLRLAGSPLEGADRPLLTAPVIPKSDEIEAQLRQHIIGQNHVAQAVTTTINVRAAGLDTRPGHPLGVFLFTGPTGVGKTEFAITLAAAITGSKGRLLRVDCSEYSDSHENARLLGAPPGFRGYGDRTPLETFLDNPAGGVLLLDEFEKADQALHRMCLQMFDAGRLTTSAGKTLDLSRFVIIATTNIRSHRRNPVGFGASQKGPQTLAIPLKELKQVFADELLNRFDRIIPFRPIDPETALRIIREKLVPNAKHLLEVTFGIELQIDPRIEQAVLRLGFSEEFGARHLHRAFSEIVMEPLALRLRSGCLRCKRIILRPGAGQGTSEVDFD